MHEESGGAQHYPEQDRCRCQRGRNQMAPRSEPHTCKRAYVTTAYCLLRDTVVVRLFPFGVKGNSAVDSFANMFLSNVTNDIGTGPPPCHVRTVIAAVVILRCTLALVPCAWIRLAPDDSTHSKFKLRTTPSGCHIHSTILRRTVIRPVTPPLANLSH